MSLQHAGSFLEKMRASHEFRSMVERMGNAGDLAEFLREQRLYFDQRDLAGAMAECMAQ